MLWTYTGGITIHNCHVTATFVEWDIPRRRFDGNFSDNSLSLSPQSESRHWNLRNVAICQQSVTMQIFSFPFLCARYKHAHSFCCCVLCYYFTIVMCSFSTVLWTEFRWKKSRDRSWILLLLHVTTKLIFFNVALL